MENIPARHAVEITDLPPEELERYGILYNLSGRGRDTGNVVSSSGDGWEATDIRGPLIDTIGTLGYTLGCGTPFVCREVERHLHTEEAQIPIDRPICFCLAPATPEPPKTGALIPVIFRPGYIFVIHRGTWHSASHGIGAPARYHWMAWVYRNEPTLWTPPEGGPLRVTAEET